ncbi:hypothetical protein [Brevundimonas sp.]|uniref:hypothetical protein n=1 Tax=Brevundimonas sp. TaxID=1871086 RepID=UPI0028B0874F|nr:hypothetical protein [Brevundimonas sp.]
MKEWGLVAMGGGLLVSILAAGWGVLAFNAFVESPSGIGSLLAGAIGLAVGWLAMQVGFFLYLFGRVEEKLSVRSKTEID